MNERSMTFALTDEQYGTLAKHIGVDDVAVITDYLHEMIIIHTKKLELEKKRDRSSNSTDDVLHGGQRLLEDIEILGFTTDDAEEIRQSIRAARREQHVRS